MAVQNQDQKFLEVIKPHSNYEFIGRQKYWIGLSICLTLLTIIVILMLRPQGLFVTRVRA